MALQVELQITDEQYELQIQELEDNIHADTNVARRVGSREKETMLQENEQLQQDLETLKKVMASSNKRERQEKNELAKKNQAEKDSFKKLLKDDWEKAQQERERETKASRIKVKELEEQIESLKGAKRISISELQCAVPPSICNIQDKVAAEVLKQMREIEKETITMSLANSAQNEGTLNQYRQFQQFYKNVQKCVGDDDGRSVSSGAESTAARTPSEPSIHPANEQIISTRVAEAVAETEERMVGLTSAGCAAATATATATAAAANEVNCAAVNDENNRLKELLETLIAFILVIVIIIIATTRSE